MKKQSHKCKFLHLILSRGIKKTDGDKTADIIPQPMGLRLTSSSMMAANLNTNQGGEPTSQNNMRVKLPDKDDDDLSEGDNEAEVSSISLI